MNPEKLPLLIVLVIGFALLIGAHMTPRSVTYSVEELNLYVNAVDSLRGEINKKDSLLTLCTGELHVSEHNYRAVVAQLDLFTEDK